MYMPGAITILKLQSHFFLRNSGPPDIRGLLARSENDAWVVELRHKQ